MPDWFALLPKHIAKQQIAWERRHAVLRARSTGITLKELGKRMGVTPARVRELETRAMSHPRPPIDLFFEREQMIASLDHKMQMMALGRHWKECKAAHSRKLKLWHRYLDDTIGRDA